MHVTPLFPLYFQWLVSYIPIFGVHLSVNGLRVLLSFLTNEQKTYCAVSFRQVYQVAYVILKAANSPRPGNWILERSVDGRMFKPWQYYAVSDLECLQTYGIAPTVGRPRYGRDDDVICTSYYSKLNPVNNGEVTRVFLPTVLTLSRIMSSF